MGGAQIWKVLWDYHTKIENMLNRYSKGETQLMNAILEEMEVYGAIEDEVVLPGVSEVAPTNAIESQAEMLDRIKDLSADLQNLEPGDPAEGKLMKKLQKLWVLNMEREQRDLFPVIKTRLKDEQYDMARQAFTVRQELVAARGGGSPPGQYYIGLPNSGWTKSKVANAGW